MVTMKQLPIYSRMIPTIVVILVRYVILAMNIFLMDVLMRKNAHFAGVLPVLLVVSFHVVILLQLVTRLLESVLFLRYLALKTTNLVRQPMMSAVPLELSVTLSHSNVFLLRHLAFKTTNFVQPVMMSAVLKELCVTLSHSNVLFLRHLAFKTTKLVQPVMSAVLKELLVTLYNQNVLFRARSDQTLQIAYQIHNAVVISAIL